MYTQYRARPKKFGRPSGFKPKFSNKNKGRSRGERIDFSRFIKKGNQGDQSEEKAYVSKHTFADFSFNAQLHKNIARAGYIHPRPIQDQSIPTILEGKDVLLNPFDERCANWDIWTEAKTEPDFENMAESLIPLQNENDPFWINSARTIFASASYKMKDDPEKSTDRLLSLLMTASLTELEQYLSGTQAATLASDKIEAKASVAKL